MAVDREARMKNKTGLLIYWLCSTEEELLDQVLKSGKEPLTKKGIPSRYITAEVIKTIREHENTFRLFNQHIGPRCPTKICWQSTKDELQGELIEWLYTSPTTKTLRVRKRK